MLPESNQSESESESRFVQDDDQQYVYRESTTRSIQENDKFKHDTTIIEKKSDSSNLDAARVASILQEDSDLEYGNMFFPEKIMRLLDNGQESQSMWWLTEGDAFCFIPTNFDVVLDKHFQGTKFESFTRKLNRWYVDKDFVFVCTQSFLISLRK